MSTPAQQIRERARAIARLEDEIGSQIEAYGPSSSSKATGATLKASTAAAVSLPTIEPISGRESANALRPRMLADVVGQTKLKPLLRRLIDGAITTGRGLDHLLFVGASGTGKTTMATVMGNEIGTAVFALKAPVDTAMLTAVRESASPGDVIFVDEIHLQVSGDRRGLTQACDPESFYALLEDGILATPAGPLTFPRVTWIGATTDVGLLPEAMTNRFPIQPRLAPYTVADMAEIAEHNLSALQLAADRGVCALLAGAARGNPRQLNNYVRAAGMLSAGSAVSLEVAREVVEDLAGTTLDGLTDSMQVVLRFLYRNCQRTVKGETVYSASVNMLATAAGHGRDTKAIALLVEPYLIQSGFLQVTPSGRRLTDAGVSRARALSQ